MPLDNAPRAASPGACPPGQLASVLPTLVFAISLFYALFNPLAPFSRPLIEIAELVMIVEIPYAVLLMLGGAYLAEGRLPGFVLGIGAGILAAGFYAVNGAKVLALVAGVQMLLRFTRETGTHPPRRNPEEARDTGWRAEIVWVLPMFGAIGAFLVASALTRMFSFGFTPAAKAALAPIVGYYEASEGAMFLCHAAVYFLFMAFWETYMLPCARRARADARTHANALPALAGESERPAASPRPQTVIPVYNPGDARSDSLVRKLAASGLHDEDLAEARRVLRGRDQLAASLETPEAARDLLVRLASEPQAPQEAVTRLALADMALRVARAQSDACDALLGFIARAIAADARLSGAELALYLLARARLQGVPLPPREPPPLTALAAECSTLLLLVGSAGDASAVAQACGQLGLPPDTSPGPLTAAAVATAVERLQALDLISRARVAAACARAAGSPTDTQRALVRALCAALDCPLPATVRAR